MSTDNRCDLCGASSVTVQPTQYRSRWILGAPQFACSLCTATIEAEHFKRAGVEERDMMFHANLVGNHLLSSLRQPPQNGGEPA